MKNRRKRAPAPRRPNPAKTARPVWRLPFGPYLFCAALVLLYAAVNCFYRLDGLPVNSWDEARHGVSAYEMLKSGDYIVNTYAGEPDYWNLKPPLSFWPIVFFYRIFGTTVLGMRFYSALSMFLIVAAVMVFAYKRYGRLESLLSGLCVGGCAMFYYLHFARHGDADALFTLLMTVCLLFMVQLREKPDNAWICGLAFALAFLTKSWHSIMIVGIAGVYFFAAKLYRVMRARHWLLLTAGALPPIALWAFLRFRRDGMKFFSEMVRYDLLARVSEPLEGHAGDFFYYFRLPMQFSSVAGILLLLLLGDLLLLRLTGIRDPLGLPDETQGASLGGDLLAYLIWIAVPFIQFTIAGTKLSWYILPAMVPAAMLAGLTAGRILRQGNTHIVIKAVCAGLVALCVARDAARISGARENYPSDPLQDFMVQSLSASDQAASLRGRTAYLYTQERPANWTQDVLFLGEAYLDFTCANGGADSFLDASDGVLIAERALLEGDARLAGLPLLFETPEYVCLTR